MPPRLTICRFQPSTPPLSQTAAAAALSSNYVPIIAFVRWIVPVARGRQQFFFSEPWVEKATPAPSPHPPLRGEGVHDRREDGLVIYPAIGAQAPAADGHPARCR